MWRQTVKTLTTARTASSPISTKQGHTLWNNYLLLEATRTTMTSGSIVICMSVAKIENNLYAKPGDIHLCKAKVHITSQDRSGSFEMEVCEMLEIQGLQSWLQNTILANSVNFAPADWVYKFTCHSFLPPVLGQKNSNSAAMALKGTVVWIYSLAGNLTVLYVCLKWRRAWERQSTCIHVAKKLMER